MRKNILLIAASLLLALLIIWPIKGVGDWYPMHDSTHPLRLLLMSETIHHGQFPPIWADNLNSGFGYPLFHLYAPLFHTLATLFTFLGLSVLSSLKLMLFLAVMIGALGAGLFARRWGVLAALVAATAFALGPYGAVNLYVRGAFSEYLSMALIPWVFLATEKVTSLKKMVLAAIVLSLFVLSHNLIPIIVLPLVLIWMITNNTQHLKLSLGAIVLSVALSAWFVVPLLFERGFTQADQVARTTNYSLHFIEPWQMWNSTWGFGGSAPGVEDGLSFKLGKLQIILGILGFFVAVVQKRKPLILLGLFLFFSAFLTTSSSKFLWESQTLQIVQFPWRSLGVVTAILSILSAFAVSRFKSRVLRVGASIIVVGSLILLNYKYFRPQTITSDYQINQSEDIASVVPEYKPRWQTAPLPLSTNYPVTNNGLTTVARVYYPTWQVKVDGKTVPTSPGEFGLLSFPNPTSSTNIELIQSHTVLEKIAYLVTIISLFTSFYLWRKNVKV